MPAKAPEPRARVLRRSYDGMPESIDLDTIVTQLGRELRPLLTPIPPVVVSRRVPSWLSAIVLAGGAMVIGISAALIVIAVRPDPRSHAVPISPVVPHKPAIEPERAPRVIEPVVFPTRALVERVVEPRRAVEVPPPARAPAREPAPAVQVPEQPSRDTVRQALRGITGGIAACAPGAGAATLDLRFASDGRVAQARIESAQATPRQRACMITAASAARVPPFARPSLSVRYPLHL